MESTALCTEHIVLCLNAKDASKMSSRPGLAIGRVLLPFIELENI